MSDWPEEGDKAPQFTLTADNGSKWKLSEAKGNPVVVYFYPKDDTPGCTKEACAFRDQRKELNKHAGAHMRQRETLTSNPSTRSSTKRGGVAPGNNT